MDESSGSREDSVLGRRLGPYVLRRRIAAGGMGVVFDAYHERLEREVALKTLGSGDASREDIARFLNEARAAARLSHPNLVSVFDVGEHNGTRYLAMELVRGRSLYDRIRSEGPLDPTEAVELTAAACDGLQHAHDKGILHRDLKPANLLLQAPEGTPRITDFGVARAPGNQRLTATGIALGTPNYMSPEQAMGQNDSLDARSDVWGMGAILYESLTGLPPFNRASQLETMQAVVGEALVPPRTHRPEIPADVEAIVLRCLSKPREKRYPSAFDLAEDLRRTLRGEPLQAAAETPAKASRSLLYLLVTTVFVAGILTSFLGGLFVAQRRREKAPSETPAPVVVSVSLEGYLASLGERALEAEEAALIDLEALATLPAYLESRGAGPKITAEAFATAAAPLWAELAWRRSELASELPLAHRARAASLHGAGRGGRASWRALAEQIVGSEGSPSQERAHQARRIYRFLAEHGPPEESAAAREAEGRLSLGLLDFDGSRAAFDPLPREDPVLKFLARLSSDLAGSEALSGSLHVFAKSNLGPCLVSAQNQQIQIRVPGKRAALAWRGRPSVIAAADVIGDGGDELLCAENSNGLCTMTLVGINFDPKTQVGLSIGRYAGTCYGLSAGEVDGDEAQEFLVLTGNPLHLSLLQIDRATKRPRSRLVFPKDEVVAGHWDRGLLVNLDGSPGDEILLASSRPGTRVLARRAKGTERSRPAAELDLGPIGQLVAYTPSEGEPGQERALAVVSAGPQAGVVVLGAGAAGILEVLGRWPFPADVTSPELARVAVFKLADGERLVLRSFQAGPDWVLDAVPLADLDREGSAPVAVQVSRTLRATRGAAAFVAGSADDDAASELVLSRSLLGFGTPALPEAVEALKSPDAYAALKTLREESSAKEFLKTLSAPERSKAELGWLRWLAQRSRTRETEARLSFGLSNSAQGADRLRESDSICREVFALSEELVKEGTLPPGRRWQARLLGLEAAIRLEDWDLASRLSQASAGERTLLGGEVLRWQQLIKAHQVLRVEDYHPSDPKRKFAVSFPSRSSLGPNQPARLGLDSHAEEALFSELRIEPSGLIEFQFDFELRGGVSSGIVKAGLLEVGGSTGTITTGIELWLYNTNRANRIGFVRFVVGSQPVSNWVELPSLHGRLKGRLRAELGVSGGLVSNEVYLEDSLLSSYRGRFSFRYTLPRLASFGVVAPANPNGYREDPRFARRGYLDVHRLGLGLEGGAQVVSTREPQSSLGVLARGGHRAAIADLTRSLKTLRDLDSRALAFIGRAMAHARGGDEAAAAADLKRALTQYPLRVVWWLELCGPDLRGADARAVQRFLHLLTKSKDPLLVSTSRSLLGDLWQEPAPPGDDRQIPLAAYIRFRQSQLSSKERFKDAQAYRKQVGDRRIQLPWDAFPSVASPSVPALTDERLKALLATKGNLLRRYVASSIAAQGRPRSYQAQLRLAEVFKERKLLGDALAGYRRARELAPLGQRAAIEIELAVVLEGLGELPRAAVRLQAARTGGISPEGLAERLPLLAQDPRFRSLFQ